MKYQLTKYTLPSPCMRFVGVFLSCYVITCFAAASSNILHQSRGEDLRLVRHGNAHVAWTVVSSGQTPGALSSNIGRPPSAGLAEIVPPSIRRLLAPAFAVAGQSATLTVEVVGAGPFTYQWRKNGTPIAGATSATLTLPNVQPSDNGSLIDVIVTTPFGSLTSTPVALTVIAAARPVAGRIINFSVLTRIENPGDSFTMGYVIGGGSSGSKPMVIRAAGPSLGAFGVARTLDDPKLEFYSGATKTGENDNWGGSPALATAMAAVGAFPFNGPTSRDSAATAIVAYGDNSVRVSASGSGTGTVIAEVYDATPPEQFLSLAPSLVNVSVLKSIGSGLTVGFVIGGRRSITILVRAVGSGIAGPPFNVAGAVQDPQISVFREQTMIAENNDWGGTSRLRDAFSEVGAFKLPDASKDAALLVDVEPGAYSIMVAGVNGSTGSALVEVYVMPQIEQLAAAKQ